MGKVVKKRYIMKRKEGEFIQLPGVVGNLTSNFSWLWLLSGLNVFFSSGILICTEAIMPPFPKPGFCRYSGTKSWRRR